MFTLTIRRAMAACFVIAVAALGACSDATTGTEDGLGAPEEHPSAPIGTAHIAPDSVIIEPNDSMYFVVTDGLTQGVAPTTGVTWSATAGSIDSAGLYHAPSAPGTYYVIAGQGSSSDSAVVTVKAPLAPEIAKAVSTSYWVEIAPGSISLQAGAKTQFTAAYRTSDGGTYSMRAVWRATGGSITAAGSYTAPTASGIYYVIVNREGDSAADTAAVTVTGGTAGGSSEPSTGDAAVGSESARRSGFWIEILPATLSLPVSGRQQFTAVGRTYNGKSYSVSVNWGATGGSITSKGYYTAPSSAGTYRVIATRVGDTQADTTVVTVGSGSSGGGSTPPTLSAVVVTPGTASIAVGGTQQFSASGKMSDGSSTSVSVTWSATGGTVSSSGLYTAGTAAGAYRVIAQQQGSTKADTSAITVTAGATAPPPSTGSTANPSLLPAATGQKGVSASEYTALPVFSRSSGTQAGTNPRNMAAGQYYVDPAFGTNVIRLTSASFPASNGGAYLDYWEGGSRISYPWGANNEWYTIKVSAGSYYLVDFNIRTYELRNQRAVPSGAGELQSAFSLDPSTPQILYTWSGSTIRKWNTATSPATEVTGGGFPKSVPGSGGYWFSMSKNDEWFVASSGSASTSTIYAWRRSTNTITSVTISGDYNEQKLDKSGRYVWVNRDGGIQIWDAQTGTLGPNRSFGSNSVDYQGHAGIGQGYAVGSNNSGAAPWFWRTNMSSLEANPEFTSATAINPYEINNSAIWVSQAATSNQWYLATNTYGSPTYSGAKLQMAIGLVRMDASEARGVAHHYNTGSVGSYFGQYAWGNISPDGRLSAFVTNFNGGSRTDVMLVPTPTN